ncbi:hypothetical protein ACFLYL_04445 [Chloroflexota bacterium]
MGSYSIATATVTGYRAGEKAAKYARLREPIGLNQNEVEGFKRDLYACLNEGRIDPEGVLVEIQKTVLPYDVLILKHEASLKKALSKVERIRDELVPEMGAKDPHYLMELRGVRNMVLVAEGMIRASLMRTESRGSHYREDYAGRDDNNWLKHIVISNEDGRLSLSTVPLPLDKYKFKPSRYYSDNFKIPE